MNVAFLAILRFKGLTDTAIGATFSSELLMFFGTLSIVVAALLIFVQKNFKRLLAYSSIEHAGLLALGFGFGGAGTLVSLLHMLYHTLGKALVFFVAGNVFLKYGTTKMHQVTGVLRALPFSGPVFFVALLALLGLPPFGIFFTKLSLLVAGMETMPYVVALVLLALAVIFFGFLRHAHAMLFGATPEGVVVGESNMLTVWPVVLLLGLFLVLSWYLPTPLSELMSTAVANLSLTR